jgi:Rifampin ADP-ribosyl transferase
VAGLVPGQKLLPPLLADACSCADYDGEHCRTDRVYLTTDAEEAAVYAALTASGGGGDVYEVEPVGALEPDPAAAAGTGSYATPAATVVRVIRRGVPLEEAAARMRALVPRLERGEARRSAIPLEYGISVEELI